MSAFTEHTSTLDKRFQISMYPISLTLALALVASSLLATAAPAPSADGILGLEARYLVWDADIATVYFGPNVIAKEGHDTSPSTAIASAAALSAAGWQSGGFLSYPAGPRPFTVKSTLGAGQVALASTVLPPSRLHSAAWLRMLSRRLSSQILRYLVYDLAPRPWHYT